MYELVWPSQTYARISKPRDTDVIDGVYISNSRTGDAMLQHQEVMSSNAGIPRFETEWHDAGSISK